MKPFLAALVLLAAAVHASATVVVPADVAELAHDARAIVRGRVTAIDGQWTDDRRTIETIVTLEVEGYLKGDLGPTVRFRVPGGDLGRYRSVVVGAPQFAVDEHVVVFLGANGPVVPFVVGFNQGVFRVVPTPDRSGWIVTPPPLLPSAGVSTAVVRGDPARRPAPLAEFESKIRALAGASR